MTLGITVRKRIQNSNHNNIKTNHNNKKNNNNNNNDNDNDSNNNNNNDKRRGAATAVGDINTPSAPSGKQLVPFEFTETSLGKLKN